MRYLALVLVALTVARAGYGQTAEPPPPLPDLGSITVPVATEPALQAAVRALTSNTSIVIEPGTYRLTGTLYVRGNLSNVSIRGATGNRDDVVLVGAGMANSAGPPFAIWTGGAVDGVTIADLTIRDVFEHAIILNPGTRRPHIYNVRLLDAGAQFIKGNPDPAGNGVDNGVLEYSLIEYTTTSKSYYTNGIDIHGGWNWVIRRNVFRNITAPPGELAGPAVLMWNHAGNTITDGNLFFNCARGISYGLLDRAGLDHSGGIIRNNVIFRTATQPGDTGIHVADSPDTQILNNTVFLSGTYGTPIEYRYASAARLLLINNLLDGRMAARDGATATVRNNLTGATAGLFANALDGDLHLAAPATAAIDTGLMVVDVPEDVDGRPRPVGTAYDIGADEFELLPTPLPDAPAAAPVAEPSPAAPAPAPADAGPLVQ